MKDAYYFSHDANARNDQKILAMRSVFGSEGYGWYWIIIEMMRETTNFMIKIDKYTFQALAMQMHCDADIAHKFVSDCINEFSLFESDGEFFWANSLLRRMAQREEKSEQARAAAKARWGNKRSSNTKLDKHEKSPYECKLNADAMQELCDSNAIKEKKVKESTVKNSTHVCSDGTHESDSGNLAQLHNHYPPEYEEFWQAYPLERRKEKKAAYRAWKARLKTGAKPEQLIRAATLYAQECKGKEARFIKLPKTFLGPDDHWQEYQDLRAAPEPKHFTHEHPLTDLQTVIQRKTMVGIGGEDP